MRRIPGPPQYGPGTDLIGHAHPTGEIRINKLALEPGVSPGSVKSYADAFEREGLLTVARPGTARLLSLENDSFAARELKRACMALLLVPGRHRRDRARKYLGHGLREHCGGDL